MRILRKPTLANKTSHFYQNFHNLYYPHVVVMLIYGKKGENKMTKIMGHRGAKSECTENTMEAFKKAVKLDAYGIETDVHMLFDGSLVMYHDTVINKIGQSIYKFDGKTVGKTLPEAPFFEDMLKYYSKTGKVLNIEIKDESGFYTDVGDAVANMLKKYNMQDRTIISSFNHRIIAEIKKKYPEFKVGALYWYTSGLDIVSYCKKHSIDAVHPHFSDVDRDFVEKCHKAGIDVNVWTVNTTADMLRMKEIGVDIIMTDNIPLAKEVYGE